MKELNALAICGSLREGSYNLKLLNTAKTISQAAGVKVTTADLKALNLPMYNYDLESAGFPAQANELTEMVKAADVLLIASPEYNYSVSGALKNAIDWVSRVKPNPFSGKTAAIFGASTSSLGTVRGQIHLRQILTVINVFALPQPQVLVPLAETAFEQDGSLKNKDLEARLKQLLLKTYEFVQKQ